MLDTLGVPFVISKYDDKSDREESMEWRPSPKPRPKPNQ